MTGRAVESSARHRGRRSPGEVPERLFRSILLGLAHRRALGRLATRLPLTRRMVRRFVAGETFEQAAAGLAALSSAGFQTTLDVLGESVATPADATAAVERYLRVLDQLAVGGFSPNVSLKPTQMGLAIDPELAAKNVARVFAKAAELGAFVRIDMEDHATTDATLALWRKIRPTNPNSGVVLQAALRRTPVDAEALAAEGAAVRLCKGAYKEPSAVAYPDKPDVDRAYVEVLEILLRGTGHVAIATHDEKMIARAVTLVRELNVPMERFEFQMLYGIRRDLQERLLAAGYTVRIYVPFGTEWYPYFMRRLAERPANVIFLLSNLFKGGSRA